MAKLARELDRAARIIFSPDNHLWSLLDTIETYGPEAHLLVGDPESDPNPARNWDLGRRNAKYVEDYFRKRCGRKVPARLDEAVAEIRARLAALAKYPVVPGTPWAELLTILGKVEIFQRDTPEA
jgi:hypothetical protein